ncbi:MAG TPA: hypothetical protein VGX03_10895 [Candidatus Binatia bacterium]|jgi:hypothetical protein|nr:hypothetical protein [Candidatus Binatia bacterium]
MTITKLLLVSTIFFTAFCLFLRELSTAPVASPSEERYHRGKTLHD